MGDVGVLEAAQDVDDGIDFADVGEELVAQALALGSASDQASFNSFIEASISVSSPI